MIKDNFIKKLETDNYYIGSFDAYINDETNNLLKEKLGLTEEEINEYLKQMPTTYRASIVDKNGNYVGFIGISNVDAKNKEANIIFETKEDLNDEQKLEIFSEYKKYLNESININKFDNERETKVQIITENEYFERGISEEILDKYINYYGYNIPKMQLAATIKDNDRVIGIIGLTKLIWSNNRADLNLFLDKDININTELVSEIIDDYMSYIHQENVHNVSFSVGNNQKQIKEALNNSSMQYYASIPYGDIQENKIGDLLLYQHLSGLKEGKIILPEPIYIDKNVFDTQKKDMANIIVIDDQYKMVKPSAFEDNNIDFDNVFIGYMDAMTKRNNFTIPLGEDKYFLQKGNEKYGLYKALANYNYVVLDDQNNFAGYINILRQDEEKKHCDIEIGIKPEIQKRGLGTKVTNKFYDELFSVGYASISSQVFEFNLASNKMFNKIADYNGTRIESYYINGEYWDMDIYTKVNPAVIKHM